MALGLIGDHTISQGLAKTLDGSEGGREIMCDIGNQVTALLLLTAQLVHIAFYSISHGIEGGRQTSEFILGFRLGYTLRILALFHLLSGRGQQFKGTCETAHQQEAEKRHDQGDDQSCDKNSLVNLAQKMIWALFGRGHKHRTQNFTTLPL